MRGKNEELQGTNKVATELDFSYQKCGNGVELQEPDKWATDLGHQGTNKDVTGVGLHLLYK